MVSRNLFIFWCLYSEGRRLQSVLDYLKIFIVLSQIRSYVVLLFFQFISFPPSARACPPIQLHKWITHFLLPILFLHLPGSTYEFSTVSLLLCYLMKLWHDWNLEIYYNLALHACIWWESPYSRSDFLPEYMSLFDFLISCKVYSSFLYNLPVLWCQVFTSLSPLTGFYNYSWQEFLQALISRISCALFFQKCHSYILSL